MTLDHLIRVLEETVDNLAPKHVGTSVLLTSTRSKLRGVVNELKHQREQIHQERLEAADLEEVHLRG